MFASDEVRLSVANAALASDPRSASRWLMIETPRRSRRSRVSWSPFAFRPVKVSTRPFAPAAIVSLCSRTMIVRSHPLPRDLRDPRLLPTR